jgi:hypothetical protein
MVVGSSVKISFTLVPEDLYRIVAITDCVVALNALDAFVLLALAR